MKMDLCRPCAEELKHDGRECKLVRREVNEKITCAVCGCKRYGGTYEVSKGANHG